MIKLMIAEDEKMARESIKKLIETYFSDEILIVAECDNGEDAVEKALSLRPEILLLDIHMPKKDGLTAAKTIKFYMEDIEIVIITANSQFEYAQQAIQLKVEDFLVKPYSIKTFKEAIINVIAKVNKKKNQKNQKKELEKSLDNIKILLEKEFLFDMINNKKITKEEAENYIKLLKLDNLYFNCSIYKIGNLKRISEISGNVRKEFCNSSVKILDSFYLDKLVIYTFGNEPKIIDEVNNRMKSHIQKKFKETTVERSENHLKSEELILAFQEAKNKLNVNDSILTYDIPYDLENELFKSVLENEVENKDIIIKENVEGIFSYLFAKNKNLEIYFIKNYVKQLILMLDRTIQKIVLDKKETQNTEEIFELIDNAVTIDEHKNVLVNYIDKNNNLISDVKDKKYVKVIEYAKQYIENNFDKNISLDDVAQHIGLSSNYLSKYFKKVENINFKDYATNIRIEKAKLLLESGEGNVSEVSEKLGYTDVSYFSYAFKKKTGLSPKEYFIKKRR